MTNLLASWYRITLRWSSDGDFPTKAEQHEVLSDSRVNAVRFVLDTSEHAQQIVALHMKRLRFATDEEARDFFAAIGEVQP